MSKVGGNRNYGYGKQLAWAGKNALLDRYGPGHFSTRASHLERWHRFVVFLQGEGISDARQIDKKNIEWYAAHLRDQVTSGEIKVAYAQNLISTINIIMETFRKDAQLSIKPSEWVGKRSHVRTVAPVSLNPAHLEGPINKLKAKGEIRVALIASLARSFGLRFKEACLLNTRQALKEARTLGRINITQGTKGGRGKGCDRWVPADQNHIALLTKAAKVQGAAKNLIPTESRYNVWRDHANAQWQAANKDTEINGFHDLRAAYACERYHALTGYPAPVITGNRQADKAMDTQVRVLLSQELGHNRIDVLAAYIGSSK